MAAKTKPTNCNKSLFPSSLLREGDVTAVNPRRPVLRTVDARPCVLRTSLTHLHCTRSALSSCVSARSLPACGKSESSPTSDNATRCSSAAWFRYFTRAIRSNASRGLPTMAPPGDKSLCELFPCAYSYVRWDRPRTNCLDDLARNPATSSHDVIVDPDRRRL